MLHFVLSGIYWIKDPRTSSDKRSEEMPLKKVYKPDMVLPMYPGISRELWPHLADLPAAYQVERREGDGCEGDGTASSSKEPPRVPGADGDASGSQDGLQATSGDGAAASSDGFWRKDYLPKVKTKAKPPKQLGPTPKNSPTPKSGPGWRLQMAREEPQATGMLGAFTGIPEMPEVEEHTAEELNYYRQEDERQATVNPQPQQRGAWPRWNEWIRQKKADTWADEENKNAANESDDDQTWGSWEPLPTTKEEEDTVPSRAGPWLDYEWKGIPNSNRQKWAAERGGWRKRRGGANQAFFCAKFHKDHGQSHSWYFRNGS